MLAVEVLLRWQKSANEVIPPSDFLSLLEDIGLIVPVGNWVLETSCMYREEWRQKGLIPDECTICVNLSARQIIEPDFADTVKFILAQTKMPPALLELEITESILLEDQETVSEALLELQELGVLVAIDDFGTGYSSFSYLKSFPVDILKIDRSFVYDVCSDAGSAAIVSSIISLAHNLGMQVVGEGVEDDYSLRYLIDHECDRVQGFLFSEPLPYSEFIAYVETMTVKNEAAEGQIEVMSHVITDTVVTEPVVTSDNDNKPTEDKASSTSLNPFLSHRA